MEPNESNVGDKDPMEGSSFLYRAMVVRDPSKRKVKPVENHMQLLDFGDLEDSSDDSDFKIGEHSQESNEDSGESNDDQSEDEDDQGESTEPSENVKVKEDPDIEKEEPSKDIIVKKEDIEKGLHDEIKVKPIEGLPKKIKVLICSVCLGDISLLPITVTRQGEKMLSEEDDEIVECDCCGISVHEGCYGISDSETAVSTVSSYSTEPWFCDACKAGNMNPVCELCPNTGGIFKETDVGKWVHLVCALYIPGVAFGDVDKLSPVTLFEMPYSRWGAKACSLCEDDRLCRTGVCINCDAGMCRNYFHVTCAQKEGLLSKASTEEDIADPFFAYCKLHSDKVLSRNKRRNYLALQSQARGSKLNNDPITDEKARIERKLNWHRDRYLADKEKRPQPWVPTQKMPRLLTTSPSACKKLLKKAELLGLSPETHLPGFEMLDIRRKWHVPPAFSPEFVTYYLDRNLRMVSMQHRLDDLITQNSRLQEQEQSLRVTYERVVTEVEILRKENSQMLEVGMKYFRMLGDLAGEKFPLPDALKPKPLKCLSKNKKSDGTGSVIMECGICHKSHDQHQLAKCDSCQLHYHLACLDPPLSRMPKKTKSLGWQCSECDKTTETEEQVDSVDPNAPRKLRHGKGPALGPEKARRGRSRKRIAADGTCLEDKSSEIWISSGNEEDPEDPESPKPRSTGKKKRRSMDLGYRKSRRRNIKRRSTRESATEDDGTNEEPEVKTPRHSTRRTSST